jgi:uncharacterized protein (TIGR02452 family)
MSSTTIRTEILKMQTGFNLNVAQGIMKNIGKGSYCYLGNLGDSGYLQISKANYGLQEMGCDGLYETFKKTPTIDRETLVKVWEQTDKYCRQGNYTSPGGVKHNLGWIGLSGQIKEIDILSPPSVMNRPYTKTNVIVENKDCLYAAAEAVAQGSRVCVLDAASKNHFGGGYKTGASAQEEDICRRSCLANIIVTPPTIEKSLYPLNNKCLFVPNVPVFRYDRNTTPPYAMMPKPVLVDVGIVAAERNPILITGIDGKLHLNKDDAKTLKNRIRNFFEAARLGGSDTLVIVPLGCGAFENPPGHVCELFVEVMKEYEGVFKKIIFAIIDDKNTGKTHNPLGNYTPFLECVNKYNRDRGQAGGGQKNTNTSKRHTLKNNKLKSRKIKKHASTSISTPTTRFTKKKHHSKHSHNKKHKTRRSKH